MATPGEQFRSALEHPPLVLPGVFNALVARMAERAGFRAVYQSGAAMSAVVAALPDVGLFTQTEFAQQARYLTQAVTIPVISDADTGFGAALAVERTVREFESAGLAGLHLEDQDLPKRCGHLSGKTLVSAEDMASKIKAAVHSRSDSSFVIIARTDARSVEGLPGAIKRAQRYAQAGADLIFPEALQSADEFEHFASQISIPLLANMTEFGQSPLLTAEELAQLGFAAVLFPVTLLRSAMKAVEQTLAQLHFTGTQAAALETMQTRSELYDLLNYQGYEARDQAYFDNTMPDRT